MSKATTSSSASSARTRWLVPVVAFLGVGLVLAVVVWWSHSTFGSVERTPPLPAFPGSDVLSGWFHFDGWWYQSIVDDGYSYAGPLVQASAAFFPAYPLAMGLVHLAVPSPVLPGMIVTFSCGLGATVLFHRWSAAKFGAGPANLAVATLLLFPYSFYLFGAVYPQALFLLAAVAAFLLLERGHPVLAGLAGAVCTATHAEGVAVLVGLVAVTLYRRSRTGRPLRPADAGVLLSAGGLVVWSAYLWVRFGDPLVWVKIQRAWTAPQGPVTWFKVRFFERVVQIPGWVTDLIGDTNVNDPDPASRLTYVAALIGHAIVVVVAVALVVVVFRKLGWGYGLYAASVLAVPILGSDDLQGAGRYALALFPCFAVAGELLDRHRLAGIVWLPVSAALLVFVASSYARGYYVA